MSESFRKIVRIFRLVYTGICMLVYWDDILFIYTYTFIHAYTTNQKYFIAETSIHITETSEEHK